MAYVICAGAALMLGMFIGIVACLTDIGFYRVEAIRFALRDLLRRQE